MLTHRFYQTIRETVISKCLYMDFGFLTTQLQVIPQLAVLKLF